MTIPTPPTPVTILTGFLGSGKTTLLLNLIPQLPKDYKLCLLKNEFGDVAVDSQLSLASSISGVTELLNGCICCNLVGQLSDSLIELREKYSPDRIVIETSGSAFPATLAMEVNRLSSQGFVLDGTVLVVDVENWKGYDDSSYTAKVQFRYTDVVILNKWESCSERQLDDAVDRIRDLDDDTPYIRSDKGIVDKDVVFGIDGALARHLTSEETEKDKHRHDHTSEVDVLSLRGVHIEKTVLGKLLESAPREEIYRIKGVIDMGEAPDGHVEGGRYILNWAFGRWNFTLLPFGDNTGKTEKEVRLTFVLSRGEGNMWKRKLETMLPDCKVEKLA